MAIRPGPGLDAAGGGVGDVTFDVDQYLGAFNFNTPGQAKGLNGRLDDLAIYEGKLTATQIQELFDGTISPTDIGSNPSVVPPEAFEVTRGDLASGGLPELALSDNVDLSARRRTNDVQSRVFLEVTATSPSINPSQFEFTLESSVFARSEVVQSIDLFNYITGVFEEVDTRSAMRFSDQVTTVTPGGDLGRFVDPGSNEILARARYESLNPRQQFTANIDQTVWTITP